MGRISGMTPVDGLTGDEWMELIQPNDKGGYDTKRVQVSQLMDGGSSVNIESDGSSDISLAAGDSYVIPARDRTKIVVYANPANKGYLRVGPDADSVHGYPLPPGGSYTFHTSVPLTVYASEQSGVFGYIEEYKG